MQSPAAAGSWLGVGCGVWRAHQCPFGVLHRSVPQPPCWQNSRSMAARQPAGGTETLRWPQSRSEYAHVRLTWRASRLSGQLYFHARLHVFARRCLWRRAGLCRQAAGRRAWHLGVTCGGCGALRKEPRRSLPERRAARGGGADAALSARGRRESSSIPSRRRAAHATKGYKNTQGQTNVSFLPLRPGRDCLNTGVASDFCVSLNTASVLTLSTDPTMLYSAA